MGRFCLLLLLPLLLPLTIGAETKEYTPREVPNVQLQDRNRYVSDPQGYFSTDDRTRLDQALALLRRRYGAEVVLVVLPGIEGNDPETFAVELFELWGLGGKELDNGLLILYKYGKKGDRIIRIETGYGLEGVLPDITTKRLTNRFLLPAITKGDDANGFLGMIEAIDRLLSEEYATGDIPTSSSTEQNKAVSTLLWGYLAFALSVGFLFALGLWSRWRKEREPALKLSLLQKNFSMPRQLWQWLIFPALLFLWPLYKLLMRRSRKQQTNCPQCHTQGSVQVTNAPYNLQYLTSAQAMEQQLHSVSYTTYHCTTCAYQRVVGIPNLLSGYSRCPRCGTRSYRLEREEEHRRYVMKYYRCHYCNHTATERINISSHDNGAPFFGGGGFGSGGSGGSFGGGFGGGMSGGGGSTTRF